MVKSDVQTNEHLQMIAMFESSYWPKTFECDKTTLAKNELPIECVCDSQSCFHAPIMAENDQM